MRALRVPPFKQSPSFCGPATLRMVLGYYGIDASEEEIGIRAKTTVSNGTTPANLARAAASFGLRGAWKRHATIRDLRRALERGIPPIINWFSTDEGHYSVVVGVDEERVTILDPETARKRSFPTDTLMRVWFDYPFPHPKRTADFRVRWMLALNARDAS